MLVLFQDPETLLRAAVESQWPLLEHKKTEGLLQPAVLNSQRTGNITRQATSDFQGSLSDFVIRGWKHIAEHLYFDSVCFFAHGYSGLRPASARAAHRRRSLFAPDCMIILKVYCYMFDMQASYCARYHRRYPSTFSIIT